MPFQELIGSVSVLFHNAHLLSTSTLRLNFLGCCGVAAAVSEASTMFSLRVNDNQSGAVMMVAESRDGHPVAVNAWGKQLKSPARMERHSADLKKLAPIFFDDSDRLDSLPESK